MHRDLSNLTLEIVYVSKENGEVLEEFELGESYSSSAMRRQVIDQHVNKFLDKHPEIKELLTVENQGRSGKELLVNGLYCQDVSMPGSTKTREIIRIVLRPVLSRSQLLLRIKEFSTRSEMAKTSEPLGTQPQSRSLSMMADSAYEQHQGELKIGVLFGDPLVQKTSTGTGYPASEPISFEHEIHRIIAKTKVAES